MFPASRDVPALYRDPRMTPLDLKWGIAWNQALSKNVIGILMWGTNLEMQNIEIETSDFKGMGVMHAHNANNYVQYFPIYLLS